MKIHQAEEYYIVRIGPPPKPTPAWLIELGAWGMIALVGLCAWLAWGAWRGWFDAVLAPVFKMAGILQ